MVNFLLSHAAKYNISERQRAALHKGLQETVMPQLPSYKQCITILRAHIHQPHVHLACEQDHYVHGVPIGQMTQAEQVALECPTCKVRLTDENGRARKVSGTPHPRMW